jgi:predicted RNase H-like HicB family nuclease
VVVVAAQCQPFLEGLGDASRRRRIIKEGIMTSKAVKLKVAASIVKDCTFWAEGDGWDGLCEELSVNVRGNSFEDAKRQMEAALHGYIEKVLHKYSRTGKRIA